MKKKTKSILLRVATGVVSIITLVVVGVVSYGFGYKKGEEDTEQSWIDTIHGMYS